MLEHCVTARNHATASENRIHDDEVAQRYGFQGGLVPGVTVYGYACAPILEALGPAWVTGGSAAMRFRSPCYDGEQLEVRATAPAGATGPLEVTASVGERVCATGIAALDAEGPSLGIPAAALPETRPDASAEVFRPGRVLGSAPLDTSPEARDRYLEVIGEPSPQYRERGWLHPGQLLSSANSILTANVVMPAWVHVESSIRHRRPVVAGEPVEVRARVAEAFERKGHHFVGLDVEWVAAGDVVAAARHVAIWQLAGTPTG